MGCEVEVLVDEGPDAARHSSCSPASRLGAEDEGVTGDPSISGRADGSVGE